MKQISSFLIIVMLWSTLSAQTNVTAGTNTVSTNGTYSKFLPKGVPYTPEVDSFSLPRNLAFSLLRYRQDYDSMKNLLDRSQQTLDAASTLLRTKDDRINLLESINSVMEKQIVYYRQWGSLLEQQEKKLTEMNRHIILFVAGSFVIGIGITVLGVWLAAKALQAIK